MSVATKGFLPTSTASDLSTIASNNDFADISVTFAQSEITALRNSWAGMKDDPRAMEKASVQGTASAFFCQQFYDNLLGEFPELKVLFPSLKAQASAMAGMLSLVISQLENLHKVTDILSSLGKRHSRIIGVSVEHYEQVGNALLKTLQDRCHEDFTLELENAWIKLYSYIANLMLQAGEDPPIEKVQPNSDNLDLARAVSTTSTDSTGLTTISYQNTNVSTSVGTVATPLSSVVNAKTGPVITSKPSGTLAATIQSRRLASAPPNTIHTTSSVSDSVTSKRQASDRFNLKTKGNRKRTGKKDGQECSIM